MKKVLIIGMGQIGTYLYELLKNDHVVCGITRKDLNITDYKALESLIVDFEPDEVYNLAGETNTKNAIENPIETFESTAKAVWNICEIIRNIKKPIKLFQALSSEMFKDSSEKITKKSINFTPKTPYSISKVASYWTIKYYRERYNLPFYNGFIFNTDSRLRKGDYLFPKICNTLKSESKVLHVDNLYARKDWLHASDVAKGIYLCMQGSPGEYIFSTGKTHTVQDLLTISYNCIGIELEWRNNIGIDKKTGEELVFSKNNFVTEAISGEDEDLKKLGWKVMYTLEDIVKDVLNF